MKTYVIPSNIRHDVKNYVMTSKIQKVRLNKVSKIFHDDKKHVITSNITEIMAWCAPPPPPPEVANDNPRDSHGNRISPGPDITPFDLLQ